MHTVIKILFMTASCMHNAAYDCCQESVFQLSLPNEIIECNAPFTFFYSVVIHATYNWCGNVLENANGL